MPGSETATATGAGSSFRALRSRPFRLYFAGQAVSASGSFLQQTAIGWLVLELTRSASDLGLVLAAGGIPALLFGPWGGAVADRVDLRKLLIVAQTLSCLLAALLWALAVVGAASVEALMTIGVAGGPALAGVLIVTVGTKVCFGLNASSYLAVIAALFVIRPHKAGGAAPSGRRGVKEGLRYAAGRQQLSLALGWLSETSWPSGSYLQVAVPADSVTPTRLPSTSYR